MLPLHILYNIIHLINSSSSIECRLKCNLMRCNMNYECLDAVRKRLNLSTISICVYRAMLILSVIFDGLHLRVVDNTVRLRVKLCNIIQRKAF